MTYDCIVIGAGPAGIMAAVQLKRSGSSVALFEKNEVGGLLRNANAVENFIGVPGGQSGTEIIESFRKHLSDQDITPIKEEVIEVTKDGDQFIVTTPKGTYRSANVIVATGTVARKAEIEGEEQFAGEKVFYEVADLPSLKPKSTIIVIGGGDVAFDYSLNLFEQGHEPIILIRDKAVCLPLLKKRTEQKGIRFIENVEVKKIQAVDGRIEVVCGDQSFKGDHILIAVGREPRYPHLPAESRGLYRVGDVQNGRYRQVHIATGEALKAAMEITHTTSPDS